MQQKADSALLLSRYQATVDADEVDLDLIEQLLCFVCGEGHYARSQEGTTGAILIFLPGRYPMTYLVNNWCSILSHRYYVPRL